jgi:hypothetical protein
MKVKWTGPVDLMGDAYKMLFGKTEWNEPLGRARSERSVVDLLKLTIKT